MRGSDFKGTNVRENTEPRPPRSDCCSLAGCNFPFPSVKVHQAAVLVRRFCVFMVVPCRLGLVVLVYSWRPLLADRHSLRFPSLSLSEDRKGVLFLSAAGGVYWLIAIRCPSLGPFHSIGGGAHWPLTTMCPSSSSLSNLSISPALSLPLVGCANKASVLSLFDCSVSGPHRGGQAPSPLARCI